MAVSAWRIVVVEQAASFKCNIDEDIGSGRHPLTSVTLDTDALTMLTASQHVQARPTHGCDQTLLWSANAAY